MFHSGLCWTLLLTYQTFILIGFHYVYRYVILFKLVAARMYSISRSVHNGSRGCSGIHGEIGSQWPSAFLSSITVISDYDKTERAIGVQTLSRWLTDGSAIKLSEMRKARTELPSPGGERSLKCIPESEILTITHVQWKYAAINSKIMHIFRVNVRRSRGGLAADWGVQTRFRSYLACLSLRKRDSRDNTISESVRYWSLCRQPAWVSSCLILGITFNHSNILFVLDPAIPN